MGEGHRFYGMAYTVKEIFYTLQGEGRNAGRAAVFCRFAGCNLWSGREEDRAQAICRFCDTDFVGQDGLNGGRFAGAEALAARLAQEGFAARAEADLQAAVAEADIISAATLSSAPLIRGAWLKPGQHVDLVGAFNMTMREADDLALQRARVFVDTPDALEEGGDVAQAIRDGALARSAVVADLGALARGAPGRGADDEITLFKSVGASIEDLAAASLVWRRAGQAAQS